MCQPVPTREEVQVVISALLVARKEALTSGVPVAALDNDYREQEGIRIPFRELGHSCLIDFLQSMSASLSVRHRNGVSVVYPIVSEKTAHVSSLVARQKTTRRPNRSGRRPMRPTPWYPKVLQPPRRLDSRILSDIVRMARNRPDGMHRDEVLQYIRDRLNYNFEPEDLKLQLREVNHEIVVERDVIYPVSNYTEPARDSQNRSYARSNADASNNNFVAVAGNHCNIRAAGSSGSEDEDFTVYRKCSDSRVNGGAINDNATPSSPKVNDNNNNNNDNNRINGGAAESSVKNAEQVKVKGDVVDRQDYEDCESLDPENISLLISERTKFRLEKLVQNHPEGIWCAELPDLYLKEYKFPLNYEELGFGSVSDFAAYLPDVFHSVQLQDKGDFKLFDAKAVRPNLKQSERPSTQTLAALYKIYEAYGEEDLQPVPTVLPTATCQRLVPDGVMQLGETVPQISVTELDRGVNEYIDVVVVEIFTPSFFWIQLLKRTLRFKQFMNDLHTFYTQNPKKYVMPIVVMERGMNCACRYENSWHRGIIKTVKHDNTVTVMFYDYGTVQSYPPEEIHFLYRSFSALPAQAIPCGLYNVKPRETEKWLRSVTVEFTWKVLEKPLVATIAVTDADNNSMLIGLTNTEGAEDFHINDWMIEKGHAEYGKMVCIRPPNYPFRRFLECEYEVNASRCKSSSMLSEMVKLAESNGAVSSSTASKNNAKNLAWYKMLSKLRRSSKSGKNQSHIGKISMDSETRREDPEIFNEIKSQTGRNVMSECNAETNDCSTGLVRDRSQFGTGLLREMCEVHARLNVLPNIISGHKTSSGSLKSSASSSSASVIVPEDIIRDRRIGDPQLTNRNNCRYQQGKSSIGSSPKSNVASSSVSANLSENCDNEIGDLRLHPKSSSMPDGWKKCSEFGSIRSLLGGHGRMDPIDWNSIRKSKTAFKIISEASTKPTKQSFPVLSSAKKALSSVVSTSGKANDPPELGKFYRQRDVQSSTKSTSNNVPEVDNVCNGLNEVSTTSPTPKLPTAKIALWNMVERGKKNSVELEKIHNQPCVKYSTKSSSNDLSRVQKASDHVNEVSMTSSTPKLPASKRSLWDMVEQSKEKSPEFGEFHSPTGGRGRMDPVVWSEVRKKRILNSENVNDLMPATPEISTKPVKEAPIDLPKAKKGFLNLVNSSLPKAHERDAVFVPVGNIRMEQDISPTVRRLMKRLREDRSEKRVRLMIPDDVLDLLREDGDENENERDSITHGRSNSSTGSETHAEPQKTTVPSNGVTHNSSDSIARDSGSSNSPKESSKLNDASEILDSTESTDKDIRDIQTTSDNALNTTPEILQFSEEPLTAGLDRPGSNVLDKESSGNNPVKLSIFSESENTNASIENASFKSGSKLVIKLSKLLTARLDSTNDSELDSDDLCSNDDDENELRIKPSASSEKGSSTDVKKQVDDVSRERRYFDESTARRSLDSSLEKLDNAIAADEPEFFKDQDRDSVRESSETRKIGKNGAFVDAEASGPPFTSSAETALQSTKNPRPFIPIYDDTVLEEDTDEWDFSPHCANLASILETPANGEDFEDIDTNESSGEDRPRLERLENNSTKEVSSCDESSLEISDNVERDTDAGGSSRQETESETRSPEKGDTVDMSDTCTYDPVYVDASSCQPLPEGLRKPPGLALGGLDTIAEERANSPVDTSTETLLALKQMQAQIDELRRQNEEILRWRSGVGDEVLGNETPRNLQNSQPPLIPSMPNRSTSPFGSGSETTVPLANGDGSLTDDSSIVNLELPVPVSAPSILGKCDTNVKTHDRFDHQITWDSSNSGTWSVAPEGPSFNFTGGPSSDSRTFPFNGPKWEPTTRKNFEDSLEDSVKNFFERLRAKVPVPSTSVLPDSNPFKILRDGDDNREKSRKTLPPPMPPRSTTAKPWEYLMEAETRNQCGPSATKLVYEADPIMYDTSSKVSGDPSDLTPVSTAREEFAASNQRRLTSALEKADRSKPKDFVESNRGNAFYVERSHHPSLVNMKNENETPEERNLRLFNESYSFRRSKSSSFRESMTSRVPTNANTTRNGPPPLPPRPFTFDFNSLSLDEQTPCTDGLKAAEYTDSFTDEESPARSGWKRGKDDDGGAVADISSAASTVKCEAKREEAIERESRVKTENSAKREIATNRELKTGLEDAADPCQFRAYQLPHRTVYIFNLDGEGWLSTEEFAAAFTSLHALAMVNILKTMNVFVPYRTLSRSENLRFFENLERTSLGVSRDENGKIGDVLHLTPLRSTIKILRKLKFVTDDEVRRVMKERIYSEESTVLFYMVTVIQEYGMFQQSLQSSSFEPM